MAQIFFFFFNYTHMSYFMLLLTVIMKVLWNLFLQQSSSISRPGKGSSHTSSSSTSTCTKLPRERYSSNLLYSSSEEEDNSSTTTIPKSRSASLQTTYHHRSSKSRSPPCSINPFENFTVGKTSTSGQRQSIRSSEIAGQRSKNRLPVSATVAISGRSSRFNPLGQVEGCMPALIPENEEEEGRYSGRGSSRDNDRDLPIIDDWLVNDQPPSKRRKHQISSGASRKEIRSFLEGTTSSNAAPSQGSGRKRPLQRKNQTDALSLKKRSPSGSASVSNDGRQCINDEKTSSKKRKAIIVEDSLSDSDEKFLDSVIISEEDMMDSDSTMLTLASARSNHRQTKVPVLTNASTISSGAVGTCTNTPQSRFSSARSSRNSSERQSSLFPHQSASSGQPHLATCSSNTHISSTAMFNHEFHTTPPTQHTIPAINNAANITTRMSYSDVPLLRVRVKIESRSYLIPCPRKDSSGHDTKIQWLISQASERHYAQQGLRARPRLSLTTSDGAILCPTDLVSHVLSPNEEVVGVVEGWIEETLEESYLAVCKKEGVGEQKTCIYVCMCVCE